MPETVLSFVDLAPGERLLWAGAPRRGPTLRASDAPQLLFGALWTALVAFMAARALREPQSMIPVGYLILASFLVTGLRITAWPLALGAWRRSRSRYAITTERLVVATHWRTPAVVALKLAELPYASLTEERADASGTITFGWTVVGRSLPAGPPRGSRRRGEPPPEPLAELELIPDARRVYDLVVDAQRTLRTWAVADDALQSTSAREDRE